MKISTKGHYAVQAMVDIVTQEEEGPVSLATIALRQGISQNYLEQLFVKLRKAEIVTSVRGPGGGYLIARDPGEIFIGEIFEAVEENLALTECVDLGSAEPSKCSLSCDCKTQSLWATLCHHFNDLLFSISLANVVNNEISIPPVIKGKSTSQGLHRHTTPVTLR